MITTTFPIPAALSAMLLAALLGASPAFAETPGAADEIYGARAEPWETEVEARYHTETGGPDAGESSLKLEAEYGVNEALRVAVNAEFDRTPGGPRRAAGLGFEAIYSVGSIGPIEVAAYGEFGLGVNGNPDELEGKIILEYLRGTFDARLNIIADKDFNGATPVYFGYAARADMETVGALRLGVQAFGDLGTLHRSFPGADHFVGPAAFLPLLPVGKGPQLELETGYLFAVGRTRNDTDGQLRVAVELEF